MSEQRKELFEKWCELVFYIQGLGAVVQNPIEDLSAEQIAQWSVDAGETIAMFESLARKTGEFLTAG